MLCGIECEYVLIDIAGAEPGRIRDFTNLDFAAAMQLLGDRAGQDDPRLAVGDLGIRRGYWYLEGDERFDAAGKFRELVVKGVEVRTPPAPDVPSAMQALLALEAELASRLAGFGLGLAVAAYNPLRDSYQHDPPLNDWELKLRAAERSYGGSLVSTLTYGPDVNLSWSELSPEDNLHLARKLHHYAPFLVPFSFNSPYAAGARWAGYSKRTWERAGQRPVVKLYLDEDSPLVQRGESELIWPARSHHEHGRIEFKAFDAVHSPELLSACCQLLVGLCLDTTLPGRSEEVDVALYRRAAQHGFDDREIQRGSREVQERARAALSRAGDNAAADSLGVLERYLDRRATPAHDLLAREPAAERAYWPGGLSARAAAVSGSDVDIAPELLAQVEATIAEARPAIQQDGGDITLVKIEGDIVRVALSGACTHCGMAGHTLGGIRKRLAHATGLPLRVLPAIEEVPD
ncbi:MAG: glutamate-cysteine ligase family protein [Polyangiales bacterium]